jgi:hypothetical protein
MAVGGGIPANAVRRGRSALRLALFSCVSGLFLAAPLSFAAYRCTDAKGITHFGDTPPAQCGNVRIYELNKAGVVVRVIEPSLTAEQVAERERERAKAQEASRAAADARRRDNALLATYTTEKEFALALERDLRAIDDRIKAARERILAIDARRSELIEELEFYAAGRGKAFGKRREPPPELVAEQDRLREEKGRLIERITRDEATMEEIRVRNERDRKRWMELTQGGKVFPDSRAPRS